MNDGLATAARSMLALVERTAVGDAEALDLLVKTRIWAAHVELYLDRTRLRNGPQGTGQRSQP